MGPLLRLGWEILDQSVGLGRGTLYVGICGTVIVISWDGHGVGYVGTVGSFDGLDDGMGDDGGEGTRVVGSFLEADGVIDLGGIVGIGVGREFGTGVLVGVGDGTMEEVGSLVGACVGIDEDIKLSAGDDIVDCPEFGTGQFTGVGVGALDGVCRRD